MKLIIAIATLVSALHIAAAEFRTEIPKFSRYDLSGRVKPGVAELPAVKLYEAVSASKYDLAGRLKPGAIAAPSFKRYEDVTKSTFDLSGHIRGERMPSMVVTRGSVDAPEVAPIKGLQPSKEDRLKAAGFAPLQPKPERAPRPKKVEREPDDE